VARPVPWACVAALAAALPAPVLAREPAYAVTLPAGPLSAVLLEVSRASGAQFAFAEPALANRRSAALSGAYTLPRLLRAVLRGTNADFRFLTPTTVLICAHAAPHPPAPPPPRPVAGDPLPPAGIVVSAFKHDEPIGEAPISIAAWSQARLDERGITDMRAIARITPGVLFRDGWAASSNLSIRGIYSNTGSATTGVYIDDTPIQVRSLGAGVSATNMYPMLFDLERVEVLRGPQGALFGSGSEGGAIRFITRQPDFDHATLAAEAEAMATRGGEPGGELGGAWGLPLVQGRMALHLAAYVRRDGGWIDRVAYPGAAMVQPDANRQQSYAGRLALGIRLGAAVTMTPSVFVQHSAQADSSQIWSTLSDIAAGRFRNGFRIAQPTRDDFLLVSLRVEADLGGVTLHSSSSYFRRRRASTADYTDYFIEMFSRGALFSLPSVPDYVSRVDFNNNQDVFTQEVRLTSREGTRLQWVAGLFAQSARQDAIEYIHEPLLPTALLAITGRSMVSYFGSDMLPGGVSYVGKDRAVDRQVEAFGRVTLPLLQDLRASVGGRFGWTGYVQDNYQDGPQSGTIPPTTTRHGETPLLPDFGLNWRPAKGRLVYVSIAKGARLGGGNAPVSTQRCGTQLAALGLSQVPPRFASDDIWNLELGAKLALPARATLSAAAYRFTWHGIQQSYSLNCLFRYTGNNAEAQGHGVELALDASPWRGFTLSASGSYTHAAYTAATYGGVVDAATGERAVVIPAGQPLPTPAWRLSGMMRYHRRIGPLLDGYIEASGDYASAYVQSYAPDSTYYDPAIETSPAIATLRLQAGLQRGEWDAGLYADNLLDARGALQVAHNTASSINMRYVLQRPRTIGLRVTWRMP
jgi:iron complex outermembrane recepter protein